MLIDVMSDGAHPYVPCRRACAGTCASRQASAVDSSEAQMRSFRALCVRPAAAAAVVVAAAVVLVVMVVVGLVAVA